jgi:hypothetical protein
VVLALTLLAAQSFAQDRGYYLSDSYIWNGSTLQPLYTTTGITCDHWAMWYFREGAPQIPGTQWGSESGKSADGVQKAWERSKKDDEAFQREFPNFKSKSRLTYDNAVGPICVSEAAFNTTPEVAQKLGELSEQAARIGAFIRTIRQDINFAEAFGTPRGRIPTYYDKTSVEEFLERIYSLPEKALSLRAHVLNKTMPSMDYVGAQIAALDKEVEAARVRRDLLAKKYPAPTKPMELFHSPQLVSSCTGSGCTPEVPVVTCRWPREDHVIAHSDGVRDHRTGGLVGDYTDTDMICESGTHYTRHCGDDVHDVQPNGTNTCEDRGRPSN